MKAGWLRLCAVLLGLVLSVRAGESVPPGRLTATIEGIEFEYSPGREELARLLAHRFAEHNVQVAEKLVVDKSAPAPELPLSPAEMRAHRSAYLGGIAAQLGLAKPSALQEECYDAFLDTYDQDVRLFDTMREHVIPLQKVGRVALWDRADLVRRLSAGETIAGFNYDPVTKEGGVSYGFSATGKDDRFKDLDARRKELHRQYTMTVGQENGRTVYRGRVSPKGAPAPPAPSNTAADQDLAKEATTASEWFPVIIPADAAATPAAELAQQLWDGRDGKQPEGLAGLLAGIAEMVGRIPRLDPHLAFIVLHETTETGIIDRYFHGPDRRWFCDGVANYVPWRVVRDLHGNSTATTAYDLADALTHAAPFRARADLRQWPAIENETATEQLSDLDGARYAFAANAVFLMNQHAGEDILPRLFREIGQTKPDKVSIKTVEKAWKELTRTKLDAILTEAVAPPAVPAR